VEVKSASDLKDHHVQDVAIQSYVLSRSGLKLASVWLAHVNRAYVLTGPKRQWTHWLRRSMRINKLIVRGLRGFSEEQTIDLNGDIVIFSGSTAAEKRVSERQSSESCMEEL
jgi:hypothetical protein